MWHIAMPVAGAVHSIKSGNWHSDKTFVGRTERGFDFLGYPRRWGLHRLGRCAGDSLVALPLEVSETDKEIVITAGLPGVDEKDGRSDLVEGPSHHQGGEEVRDREEGAEPRHGQTLLRDLLAQPASALSGR